MEINSFIMENFPFESIYPTTDRETGGPSVAWKDGEAEVRGVCVCVCVCTRACNVCGCVYGMCVLAELSFFMEPQSLGV